MRHLHIQCIFRNIDCAAPDTECGEGRERGWGGGEIQIPNQCVLKLSSSGKCHIDRGLCYINFAEIRYCESQYCHHNSLHYGLQGTNIILAHPMQQPLKAYVKIDLPPRVGLNVKMFDYYVDY